MYEVLKAFYSIHYNVGAISALLVLLIFFLLTKKNFRWALIFFVIVIVINVFIYKKTANKTWVIQDGEQTYSFSVKNHWTIKTEDGKTLHWCWFDTWVYKFKSIDLVDILWHDSAPKIKKQVKEMESPSFPE